MDRYYLKANFQDDWQEVTKEKWIVAERQAGFRPKMSTNDPKYMKTCATGGFSGNGVSGQIKYESD